MCKSVGYVCTSVCVAVSMQKYLYRCVFTDVVVFINANVQVYVC